jgi:hypothetical protein
MANLLPLTALEPDSMVDVPAVSYQGPTYCRSICDSNRLVCNADCQWTKSTVYTCADSRRFLLTAEDGTRHCISLRGVLATAITVPATAIHNGDLIANPASSPQSTLEDINPLSMDSECWNIVSSDGEEKTICQKLGGTH